MILALYAIAVAMAAGGIAAVAQGAPYIMVERGWAMVISGTTVASAGFVLLGIAVLAGRVKRLAGEAAQWRDRTLPAALAPAPASVPAKQAASAAGDLTDVTPSRALAPSSGRSTVRISPPLDEPPVAGEERASTAVDAAPALSAHRDEPALAAAQPNGAAPGDTTSNEPAAATVVGTYSSGGNSYVMYSDGSITADTPTGTYRFQSLDGLKEFIAAGGESGGPARA